MIQLLTQNNDIQNEITKLFSCAKLIKCAVAFWGAGASKIFKPSKSTKMQVVCNLASGGTNPKEIIQIQKCYGHRMSIKMHNNLHAKIYWTDIGAVIGSSNASSNGLGLESDEISGWDEACIVTDDPKIINEIRQWFDENIWPKTETIAESDLRKASIIWKERRGRRINANVKAPFLEALNTGAYADKNIYIIISTLLMEPNEQKTGKRLAKKLIETEPRLNNKKISFWSGFHDDRSFPRDAHVFAFEYKEGKIVYDNLYRTLPKSTDLNDYQFCYQEPPTAIKMSSQHATELKNVVERYYKGRMKQVEKKEGEIITFEKFTKTVLNNQNLLKDLKRGQN
jgi:hypothetical protein